jgi:putative photosynthetic complex assembly protein
MSHPRTGHALGSPPLFGAALLLAFVLGLVMVTGGTPRGTVPRPAPVESRDLRFADLPDGSVAVFDARSGASIAQLAPGTGGFVRGALRGLARERRRENGAGEEASFRLATWPDGAFTLEDTVTGHVIDLRAFGRTQTETFLSMLHTRGGVP